VTGATIEGRFADPAAERRFLATELPDARLDEHPTGETRI